MAGFRNREELKRRMAKRKIGAEWADLMRDLPGLPETHLPLPDKRFVVRSFGGEAHTIRSDQPV